MENHEDLKVIARVFRKMLSVSSPTGRLEKPRFPGRGLCREFRREMGIGQPAKNARNAKKKQHF